MITAELDRELRSRLDALSADGLTRFSMLGGTVRGALLSGSRLVAQARANHDLGIIESLALGQALVCAGLLSTTIKDGERIGLRMDCTGALKGFSVETRWDGRLRGYLFCDGIKLGAPLESFDLKPFIGSGTLSVMRAGPAGEPYTGHISLVHGRIAEDITSYYLQSEQTRTAVAASVRFDAAGRIAGAGGLFLQALPGATDLDMEDTEDRMAELPSLGTWFAEGKTRAELLEQWFSAFEVELLSEGPVSFSCDCSKERYGAFLKNLGHDELRKMMDSGALPAEILCHNCGSVYEFSREELEALGGAGARL